LSSVQNFVIAIGKPIALLLVVQQRRHTLLLSCVS
jgi:hypothetical protein